ncbi:MAG TPA: S8 family serine peptidase [Vineibacter sp.]|nr:S8 family serine peptidase [Vineibacter sp.]
MARFVMANRRAGKFQETAKRASRAAVATTFSAIESAVSVVNDFDPPDELARRVVVFDADPKDIQAKLATSLDDVLIEPEILHWPDTVRVADFIGAARPPAARAAAAAFGSGVKVTLRVRGDGKSLRGAEVLLFLRGFGGQSGELSGITDGNGRVSFTFGSAFRPAAAVIVPAGDFWPMVARAPTNGATIDCPKLPKDGPLGWWHGVGGITRHDAKRGAGIKVGVIDTGAGPHPGLSHVVSVGAFIDGVADPAGGADVDSHGSHVCGTIGARPTSARQYAGVAPGVELFSARVFPKGAGANQGDIVNAIDALSRTRQVDLINMSLGSPSPSQIERDAIADALERGTLCICAAANSDGPVEFPAAFIESVAVSAMGLSGWGPPGSLPAGRLPQDADRFGIDNLFLANFSCFGPEIDCGAPGVGILATVPERFGLKAPYASMDGTSMASPLACGLLAALLSSDAAYKARPRDQSRAEHARRVLRERSRDIGLKQIYQGRGIPLVG